MEVYSNSPHCFAMYIQYQTILQIKVVDSVITSMNYEAVQADNLCKARTVYWKDKLNPLAPNTEFHQCLLHSLGDKHRAGDLKQPFCIHFIHSEHLKQ